ncbi:helix-turn-helix domain-containing protein [Janibacter cremeus]|uniref:Transcriptional regulator with XRE-family HTH domain n=1 Tax=Janibacter cremeus TaxID=1285192 RepID=A0A852VI36_9MICO|nr:helix-turn-helix transcriptional regulator [Janibacter cremeus]NYF96742.1 transcriptional regulator with XRE-family HTH domain [Janibacter cremeus]
MSHPARAGALLRSLRQAHGSTQSDLGHGSGVSVRTIRGLERGEIQRPQLATLQLLALALELSAQQQAEFLHAWATPQQPGYDGLLVDPTLSEMEQIDAMTRSALGAYRVISQNWHTSVGTDRRMSTTRCQIALEAVEDGLERVFNVQNGDEHTTASRLEFRALRGSRLSGRWDFEDSNVTVFGVDLPRRLAKGQFHSYEYEVLSHPDDDGTLGYSDGFIWGAPHTTRSLVVSVEFAVAPATLRRVQKAPGRHFEFLDEVPLDDSRQAALVLEDADPGAYGFTWTW